MKANLLPLELDASGAQRTRLDHVAKTHSFASVQAWFVNAGLSRQDLRGMSRR
ncbi:hypothetical protein [Cupriavidus sp. CuC1]|uniref:hypothetical protein n=1 Tax=Cupriavidus sp. CuC1 TaxID=3373131 RepID=UPI0037CF97C7